MKKLTTILLTILVLGCNAQVPDAYSQPIVDSLNAVIVQKDAPILDME